ncbi:ABC transporter ATP-binding protein [Flavobacterium sp. MAH-1]|uniref:ABC transporter ATP-binding protein n=1 Tax=Flavobacterium agri TaxID=2743471 RepID=A0A7Y9C752_9FLAO|nr:ABC transporter ATP-binding protein [Flavobacterium agri]NUY81995.1 ABC transporter ATP-binding protein [Flavobacterium agri]NYA72019.1 ABC transporter ATP-binding protein [Flavobacterium agri]
MTDPILHTRDLSIGYQSKKHTTVVASGIDLSLGSAKLVSLVGANGVGKSTLLRTLTGIQKPISGQVLLENKIVTDYSPSQLSKKLSLVLTEKLPPSNLTVFELVALGRQPYTNWVGKLTPEDISKVNEALHLTDTFHLSAKKHFQISDGQLQNVLVARALAQDTPLIVLDEPTTHLDFQHKVALFRLLKKLSSETEKCILFSTHDIEMAIELSDEIIAMNDGKAIQDTPSKLIESGGFDRLFADDNIVFDKQKGRFVFRGI